MTIVPPYCSPRSKASTGAILDALDVEHNWLAKDGHTFCNFATRAACEALEVHLPEGLLANAYQTWLSSDDGRRQGWSECNSGLARLRAEGGFPTLATLHEEPHGHICVLRGVAPTMQIGGGMIVWSAGGHNFNSAPLRLVFTEQQVPHIRWFTHD